MVIIGLSYLNALYKLHKWTKKAQSKQRNLFTKNNKALKKYNLRNKSRVLLAKRRNDLKTNLKTHWSASIRGNNNYGNLTIFYFPAVSWPSWSRWATFTRKICLCEKCWRNLSSLRWHQWSTLLVPWRRGGVSFTLALQEQLSILMQSSWIMVLLQGSKNSLWEEESNW